MTVALEIQFQPAPVDDPVARIARLETRDFDSPAALDELRLK